MTRDPRGERGLKADTQPIVETQVVKEELPTVTDEEVTPNHCVDGVLRTHCVYPDGGGTQFRYANLQPWPDKGWEMSGLGGGHSDDQLLLPTSQPGVYGGENGASLEESNAVELEI